MVRQRSVVLAWVQAVVGLGLFIVCTVLAVTERSGTFVALGVLLLVETVLSAGLARSRQRRWRRALP